MATRTTGRELQFQLLGHLGVRGPNGEIALGSPKQKAVLAVLLLNANEVVSTDRIIDLLSGDAPPRTTGQVGNVELSVANGGIDYVPSGLLSEIEPELEAMRSALAAGTIEILLDGDGDVVLVRDAIAP